MSQSRGEQGGAGRSYGRPPRLGGLLAIPAVIGYMTYLPIPIGMAVLAWRLWSPPLRSQVVAWAGGALIAGLLIHLLPHTRDGGLDAVALPLGMVATIVVLGATWRMRKAEAALARGGTERMGES